MNRHTLTQWWEQHHPYDRLDVDLWANVLPRHEPHELQAALDQWHRQHPQHAPKPAHIIDMLRAPGRDAAVAQHIAGARQALADAAVRSPWPDLSRRRAG